ncbi:MAG: hypothetical protein PVH38_09450, partial [Gammaproteobacteria bacterium]
RTRSPLTFLTITISPFNNISENWIYSKTVRHRGQSADGDSPGHCRYKAVRIAGVGSDEGGSAIPSSVLSTWIMANLMATESTEKTEIKKID